MNKIYLFLTLAILGSCCNKQTEIVKEDKNMVVETIMNRRSIRAYKPEQVSKSDLDTIIKSGINAPSALNQQNWEVRVVQNQALLLEINQGFVRYVKELSKEGSAARSQEEGFSVFHGSPTVIFIATEKDTPYGKVNGALLTQNILLAAKSLNLGTCVIGSVSSYLMSEQGKSTLAKLNISGNYEVILGISLGYPDQSPEAKPRDNTKVQYID